MSWPPDTQFWDGYIRSPEMTERLVAAFKTTLEAHPETRAAQLLALLGLPDKPVMYHFYDEDFLILLGGEA